MFKKDLPLGAIVILLILALATIGVGYGLWSETLVINGIVNTGTVDAGLSVEEVDQHYNFNDGCILKDCDNDGSLDDDLEAENKDVADCTAVLIDPHTMEVTLTNSYPSFNCFVRYNVENTGSIPIHVYRPDYFYAGIYEGTAINNDALHVNGWPPECYADMEQLEPKEVAYCNLHIHPNQGAEEGATYTFQVKIFARQWNELVPPPWRP